MLETLATKTETVVPAQPRQGLDEKLEVKIAQTN
jgi:hypothetical protein